MTERSAVINTTPRGGIKILVRLVATLPSDPKKSIRILCEPAEVLPIASSVDHPPPVTICGNTRDVGPPITSAGTTVTGVVAATVFETVDGTVTVMGAGNGTPVTLIGCVTVVIVAGSDGRPNPKPGLGPGGVPVTGCG